MAGFFRSAIGIDSENLGLRPERKDSESCRNGGRKYQAVRRGRKKDVDETNRNGACVGGVGVDGLFDPDGGKYKVRSSFFHPMIGMDLTQIFSRSGDGTSFDYG